MLSYVELTNTIILDIVSNYNEYLPFKVNLDPETTRRVIEKIKNCRNGETSKNNLKSNEKGNKKLKSKRKDKN